MNAAEVANSKHRTYSPMAMTEAYMAVRDDGMTVKKAARIFCVPTQTLRDRVLGKVDVDTAVLGKAPLFCFEEEARLSSHFKEMAKYGYVYSSRDLLDIATDFAIQVGKRSKNQPLTEKWFRGYVKRWPDVRVIRERAVGGVRACPTSKESINIYFQELDAVLYKYHLKERPHLIYSVEEKEITLDYMPPHVGAKKTTHSSVATSRKSSTITIIGCGSASGMAVPPYFVFPGAKMKLELVEGATPGAAGDVSESGCTSTDIFRQYLENQFLHYAPGRNKEPILLLLDGHKTHVSLSLIEWAKIHNIILHFLPAHANHILQPLDVACYEPFHRIFNAECQRRFKQMYP